MHVLSVKGDEEVLGYIAIYSDSGIISQEFLILKASGSYMCCVVT
jgi:hypothetical protein